MRRVTINLSDGQFDGLNKLITEKGYFNISEALRYAINFTISKEFPAYIMARNASLAKSPEEKAQAKVIQRELEADMKKKRMEEKQTGICNLLGGEIIDINGFPHCKYLSYTEIGGKKVDNGFMTEPLENLNDESVVYQYRDISGNVGEKAKEKILGLLT